MESLADALNLRGTLFLLQAHWFWMAVALWLGCWVGWRVVDEKTKPAATDETVDPGTP